MTTKCVKIVEVGPRDGLQNIKEILPTALKVALIKRLSHTGLKTIEATSFVSPQWVPQLADAKEVMKGISMFPPDRTISYPVLVPNLKGFQAALSVGVKEIGLFLSASQGFSQKNINCSIEESLQRAHVVVRAARHHDVRIRAYVSCIFECPYDGPTPHANVIRVSRQLLDMGCFEVSLGDTTGAGTPLEVRRLLSALLKAIPASQLAGHFHDTFGQAVANVMAAYDMGIRTFDSSVSGLGGCPYSPGAKGNLATEDLVYSLNRMGITTGIDLAELARIGDWIAHQVGLPNGSRAGAALIAREKLALGAQKPLRSSASYWKLVRDLDDLHVHRRGANVRITMDRPRNGNALTSSMLTDLTLLIKDFSSDPTCFRLILTANGKYFCTGMDLKNATPESRKMTFEQLRYLFDEIEASPKTTIALINGPAFGGGVGLAFACDIRIASEAAVFQLTEVKLGICPAVISKFVFREWGLSFAREAMLSARPITPRELMEKTGAVHVVSQEADMMENAEKYLHNLALCAPGASGHVKVLAKAAWEVPGASEQARVIERTFDDMMLSEESRIGSAAFARGVRETDWETVLNKRLIKL